jgi:uncharacterized protein (DUF2342 family)
MDQVGGFVFGAQVGQALGALAQEVLSATEIGLPLSAPGKPALLPANVEAFSAGLEVPADDVRLYVALRELAHQRLFASVPWLQSHLFDAVDAYARGHRGRRRRIERAVGSIDPSTPSRCSARWARACSRSSRRPRSRRRSRASRRRSPSSRGGSTPWWTPPARRPCRPRLPLRETVRRRRASGGPAEQTFATLVGLQLRPRRLREAAALWAAVAQRGGASARDALWAHPDLLPVGHRPRRPRRVRRPHRCGRRGGDRLGRRPAGLDKDLDGNLDDDAAGGPAEP